MNKYFGILCLAILFSQVSFGQGFYWNTAGARSDAFGGVYSPSAGDPLEALAVNPAGLTAVNGPTLDLSATAAFARGRFSNSVNVSAPLQTQPGVIPYGAFGMPIGKSRFSLGIGEMPELASVSDWHYVDAPGAAGASYGLQQQKSAIIALRSAAGLGFYVNPKLSLGVSVGAVYNSNTLDAPYIFQRQPVVRGLKTLLDLNTEGIGWNTGIGALIRPSRSTEISLAWKSRTTVESTGHASGNLGAEFSALGIAAPSSFDYSAAVRNVLPQSVTAGATWRLNSRWIFGLQGGWVNWKAAFRTLPVALTDGTNAAVNGLLNSTSLNDGVPLDWKDQFSVHAGVERLLTENISISGGYSHANNPVPSSTLSPLTAAIFTNQLSTGLGWTHRRARFDAAYSFGPTARQHTGESALLSGEYSDSTVRIGMQSITLSSSFRF